MGWNISSHDNIEEVMAEAIAGLRKGVAVVDQQRVGQNHWMILELNGQRSVVLLLLRKRGGEWGTKLIDEEAYPYYFDCPKRLLEVAGPPRTETAAQWRQAVLEYHEKQAIARQAKSRLAPGQKVRYGPYWYILTQNLGRRGWLAERALDRLLVRFTSKAITEALRQTQEVSDHGTQPEQPAIV